MKICFMGLTGYKLLSGDRSSGVVGPDVYQVLLARELLKHGFQVAYINYDEGGPKTETIDGIEDFSDIMTDMDDLLRLVDTPIDFDFEEEQTIEDDEIPEGTFCRIFFL